jgi:hypothetical protein
MIVEYYGQFRIADMYSLLLFILVLAALTNWIMKSVFAWVLPASRANPDAACIFRSEFWRRESWLCTRVGGNYYSSSKAHR